MNGCFEPQDRVRWNDDIDMSSIDTNARLAPDFK